MYDRFRMVGNYAQYGGWWPPSARQLIIAIENAHGPFYQHPRLQYARPGIQ